MPPDDYYRLLGVSRFASRDVLTRAYRGRLLKIHPDCNPDDTLATERTREIVEAYRTLSNPKARTQYDLALAAQDHSLLTYNRPPRVAVLSHTASRVIMTLGSVLLMVYMTILCIHAALEGQTPVYRPFPAEVRYYHATRPIPLVVEPDPTECVEWYHAQQYQLCLANDWATDEMVKVYSDAEKRAIRTGDHERAHFYAASIREARARHDVPPM